jgi:cell division protein FtsZ
VAPSVDYSKYDQPTVWRDPRSQAAARVDAMQESGMDRLDIPAFLRKQAD